MESVALIGASGIGKTSIALTVLHHHRIKERFGDNRRFILCDQLLASRGHFLARLSKVIGPGVENSEDLASLRPLLSSKEMFIILDNAESILDPQGVHAREMYAVMDELSQFSNLCLGVISRNSIVPPHCTRLEIPTLSVKAACDIFYNIYGDDEGSGILTELIQRLSFHTLSITLLATTAVNNLWKCDQLAKEWEIHRVQVLRMDQNQSLATAIELSLSSPMFQGLGPDAHGLLEAVAFFPHGIDEKNLGWFFPTIPNKENILKKLCVLSLAYRNGGFITMLPSIRDYFYPEDPTSSPLLCAAKDCYFTRLSVDLDPDQPEFRESQWIESEDTNIEHLLNVFTSIDASTLGVWDACVGFLHHLRWHKPRQTVLRSKIEALPDDHPSKPGCLFELSQLFEGNLPEEKRLLTHTLTLLRKWEDDSQVAVTLSSLSHVNRDLGLRKEGIQQVEEALEMYRQFGDVLGRVECLLDLAWLLLEVDQPDAAEDAVLRAIGFLPEKGQDYLLCQSHRILGDIYHSKGEKGKAVAHLETALRIASPFDWQEALFWVHYALATLLSDEDEFSSANTHIGQAKSHAIDDAYNLGRAMGMQAWIWYRQHRLEDARSEVLHALEVYKRLGETQDVRLCRELLGIIEREIESSISNTDGELSEYGAASHPY